MVRGLLVMYCHISDNVLQAKAMAAFISGEMKVTVQMNPPGSYSELIASIVNSQVLIFHSA